MLVDPASDSGTGMESPAYETQAFILSNNSFKCIVRDFPFHSHWKERC